MSKRMLANVPAGEKGYRPDGTLGGNQLVSFVTEPGFYRVIGQRQAGRIRDLAIRQQVMRFQEWVYHEVLPSIRRTGGYHIRRDQFGIEVPDAYTYDEVCGLLRQYYGINLTVNELTRNLRAGGLIERGDHGKGGGVDPVRIDTEWGDLSHTSEGWSFGYYSEASAEAALRDRR